MCAQAVVRVQIVRFIKNLECFENSSQRDQGGRLEVVFMDIWVMVGALAKDVLHDISGFGKTRRLFIS